MNLISSIHDTPIKAISKTHDRVDIKRCRPLASQSPNINIELYSDGFFDGLTGLNAELPHIKDYWDGYQLGYREYYCRLLGVEIPLEELPQDKMHILMTA